MELKARITFYNPVLPSTFLFILASTDKLIRNAIKKILVSSLLPAIDKKSFPSSLSGNNLLPEYARVLSSAYLERKEERYYFLSLLANCANSLLHLEAGNSVCRCKFFTRGCLSKISQFKEGNINKRSGTLPLSATPPVLNNIEKRWNAEEITELKIIKPDFFSFSSLFLPLLFKQWQDSEEKYRVTKLSSLLFFILPWYFYLESFSSRINIIHLGFHLNFHPQTWFPYSKRTFPQIKPSSIIVSNRRVYSRVVLLQGYGLNHFQVFYPW